MTPIDQTIIDPQRGNCMQAAIASLFDLELSQVPHFRIYPDKTWFKVYYYFLYGLGYDYKGCTSTLRPDETRSVEGFLMATVPSKTFPDNYHAVIVDTSGLVVHDPNPNKAWLGVNVVETKELYSWDIIVKREDP